MSARLASAVTGVADSLAVLAGHLDAVAFRDVWRAVAVAANRLLYNDVATEASFSAQVPAYASTLDTKCLDRVFVLVHLKRNNR